MKTRTSACAFAIAPSATLPCLGATDLFRCAEKQEAMSQQPAGYFVGYPARALRLHPRSPERRTGPSR